MCGYAARVGVRAQVRHVEVDERLVGAGIDHREAEATLVGDEQPFAGGVLATNSRSPVGLRAIPNGATPTEMVVATLRSIRSMTETVPALWPNRGRLAM